MKYIWLKFDMSLVIGSIFLAIKGQFLHRKPQYGALIDGF